MNRWGCIHELLILVAFLVCVWSAHDWMVKNQPTITLDTCIQCV